MYEQQCCCVLSKILPLPLYRPNLASEAPRRARLDETSRLQLAIFDLAKQLPLVLAKGTGELKNAKAATRGSDGGARFFSPSRLVSTV